MGEFYAGDYTIMNDAILSKMPAFWVAGKNSEAGLCGLCQVTTQYLYLHYNKPSVNDKTYLFSDKNLVRSRINAEFEEIAYNVIELRNHFAHNFGTPPYVELLDYVKGNRNLMFKMLVHTGALPTSKDYERIKAISTARGYPSTIELLTEICNSTHPYNYKAIMKEIDARYV